MILPVAVCAVGGAAYALYAINYDQTRKKLRDDMYAKLKSAGFEKDKIIKFYGDISPLRYRKADDCDDFYTFGNIELRIDSKHRKLAVLQYLPKNDFCQIIDFDEIIDYRIIETSPGAPKTGKTKSGTARSSATDKKDGALNRLDMQIITSNIAKPLISINIISKEVRAGSYRYKNALKFIDEAYATVLSILEDNKKRAK
mgnify:CR=1 FL=1